MRQVSFSPLLLFAFVLGISPDTFLRADDFDEAPIHYSTSSPHNRVSQLLEDLASDTHQLKHDDKHGYLRAVLDALEIPVSSQVLVFSKTSMQRDAISPRTPRAIYFNDDTYVGFCQRGSVIELSTTDDALGTVFYTLDQSDRAAARITRQTDNCLICHGSSPTRNVPGHLVRSVFTDPQGQPILTAGTFRTDHSSPLEERWGGWYVTGTHGKQRHLGNLIIQRDQNPEMADNQAGLNLTDLSKLVNTSPYLEPGSDIVALMVLEHQALLHNCITRAGFETRQALYYEKELNRELDKPIDERWASTTRRIEAACEPLVEALLFSGESPLTDEIKGTSSYAEDFMRLGSRDPLGRSLRDLDLKTRMFKYPCSYLIYSTSFQALPSEAKTYVSQRFREILTAAIPDEKFAHISAESRTAIREILAATLPEFKI